LRHSAPGDDHAWRSRNFSFRNFHLCGDAHFVGEAGDARRAPSGELTGTKTGEDGELEGFELTGALNQDISSTRQEPAAGSTTSDFKTRYAGGDGRGAPRRAERSEHVVGLSGDRTRG
jgi:hypothetical protein